MAREGESQVKAEGDEATISVIYVDDYSELCHLAESGLEAASDRIHVESTTDPTTVTDRLDEFDCIVSDYQMPETDGLELLRQVRVLDEDLPFILFTGEGSEDIASDAISLGVTDYLTKRGGQERFVRLANRIEGAVDAHRATEVVEQTKSQAKETIQRERARFRALIEHSPVLVGVLDSAGKFEYTSPSTEEMLGYKPRELQGEIAFDYVHEEDRDRIVEEFQRTLSNPEYRPTVEYRFRHKNENWVHLQTRGVNRLDDSAVKGFIVNTRDITERVRTVQRLREERDISERILEVAPAPMLLVDGAANIHRANYRAAEVFDTTPDRLTDLSAQSTDFEILTPDGDAVPTEDLVATEVLGTGQEQRGVEYHFVLPTGTFRVEVSAAPLSETDHEAAVLLIDEVERI